MEQFDIPHQRIKEKSVYLLHLDAARIILISSAIIGIIIVSFLLGMNFVRGGDGAKTLITKNDMLDSHKELDLLKNNIPGLPEEDELSKALDDKAGIYNEDKAKDKSDPDKSFIDGEGEDKAAVSKNESKDMLTKENIYEAARAEKNVKKKVAQENNYVKKVSRYDDATGKPAKKSALKNVSKKRKSNRSKVVAVAGESAEHKKPNLSGAYTIQVASYDKKATAQSEIKALKSMNYDAFIDETQVKGKQYYRVRIGPLATKKKALDMLKSVQDNDKYQESYMVQE
jgi:cell division septation protein DedD